MDDAGYQSLNHTEADIANAVEVTIAADIAGSFTYASYQNAVPVIRSVRIDNPTRSHYENIRVELSSTPTFLRNKV